MTNTLICFRHDSLIKRPQTQNKGLKENTKFTHQ